MTEDTTPLQMHYSFDYVQQVHFPNNPQQPGPAYFLTARKCQLSGVACEPLGTQDTYLIDEGEAVGKGANATISLLHHYITDHNHGIDRETKDTITQSHCWMYRHHTVSLLDVPPPHSVTTGCTVTTQCHCWMYRHHTVSLLDVHTMMKSRN